MKKIFSAAAIAALTLSLLSCEKDEGKLPNIRFITGGGYTSADASVDTSAAIHMGIVASKAEDKDVLTTFDVSRSYDGGSGSSIKNVSLSGSQGDNYSGDIWITTRKVVGTEKYTFTVVNRDGLKNQVSLTLTTHF